LIRLSEGWVEEGEGMGVGAGGRLRWREDDCFILLVLEWEGKFCIGSLNGSRRHRGRKECIMTRGEGFVRRRLRL
jgi:hypothetical protein